MKNHRIFNCLALGVLSLGIFNLAIFNHKEQVVEEAIAWNSSQTPSVDYDYYSAAEGKTGSALKTALASFNKPKSPNYDWSRYEAADEAEDDDTSILCLYTRHNIKKTSHCGNYSWDKWNREHVYPQGNFPNSDKDNHNIFACEGQINNYRSNLSFAELPNESYLSVFGNKTQCKKNSNYFEPCDAAKGEVARACMYCTIYYGYSLDQIFDSVQTAIKWHAQFPVTAREIRRNNVVYELQGNRNPFIDHPSYANSIFGANYTNADPLQDVHSTDPAVKSITLSQDSLTFDLASDNKTATLTATVTAVNDAPKTVTWMSHNTDVASVNSNGEVTAVGVGSTTIEAKSTFDSTKFASCVVTVRDSSAPVPMVSSVTITPESLNLDLNGETTATLTAHVAAFDGAAETVTWSSINNNVATVDQNGVVTARGVGTTGIKAVSTFDDSKLATCTVTVVDSTPISGDGEDHSDTEEEEENTPVTPTNVTLQSIEVTPPNKTEYVVGEQIDLTGFKVIAHYSDNTTKDVTSSVIVNVDTSEAGSVSIYVVYEENGVSASQPLTFKIVASAPTTGCASSILASSVLIFATSILGAGLILIKKHRKSEDY